MYETYDIVLALSVRIIQKSKSKNYELLQFYFTLYKIYKTFPPSVFLAMTDRLLKLCEAVHIKKAGLHFPQNHVFSKMLQLQLKPTLFSLEK